VSSVSALSASKVAHKKALLNLSASSDSYTEKNKWSEQPLVCRRAVSQTAILLLVDKND
jgi:plastocyanin domain-containing protein